MNDKINLAAKFALLDQPYHPGVNAGGSMTAEPRML